MIDAYQFDFSSVPVKLPRADHREPRRWGRFWEDKAGLICCCTGGTTLLVVASHPRFSIGGTNYTNVAFDGAGTLKWRYDLGSGFTPGQPQIATSGGDVYIPWFTSTSTGCTKLDNTGALVWTYNAGIHGNDGGFNTSPSSAFDPSGNFVFRIANTTTTNHPYALAVDSTGALVTTYYFSGVGMPVGASYPSTTRCGIAFDSSGNMYFHSDGDSRIYKVDSSGTYVARSGTLSERAYGIDCDRSASKLYVNYSPVSTHHTTTTPFASRYDCSTLTSDWDATPTSLFGLFGMDTTNSLWTDAMHCGFDPNSLTFYIGGGILLQTATPDIVTEQFLALSALGALRWVSIVDSTASNGIEGQSLCVDPVTGDVFGFTRNAVGANFDLIFRLDSSNGTVVWQSHSLVTQQNANNRINCASYS